MEIADEAGHRVSRRDDPDMLASTLSRIYVGTLVMTAIGDKLFYSDEKQQIVPVLARLMSGRQHASADPSPTRRFAARSLMHSDRQPGGSRPDEPSSAR